MSQFKPVEDGISIDPQPTERDLDDAKQQGINKELSHADY